MTREQIEELRSSLVREPFAALVTVERSEADTLLAAAERALLLEDVLAAAKVVLSDVDDAWLFGSNIQKLRSAIDRAEGK